VEEKRKLIEDNTLLDSKIEVLNFENEKLKQDIKNLASYFEQPSTMLNSFSSNFNYNNNNPNQNQISIRHMKVKIEELEDLITQYKNSNSPNKIVELEEMILNLNENLMTKNKVIDDLNLKMKNYIKQSNMLFDERQAIISLSLALREKEVMILNLKNNVRDMKDNEKIKNYELSNLNKIIENQGDSSKYLIFFKKISYE
jgi:hypothetical protein